MRGPDRLYGCQTKLGTHYKGIVKIQSRQVTTPYFCNMIRFISLLLLATSLVLACRDKKEPAGTKATEASIPPRITALSALVAKYPDSVGLRLQLVEALDSMHAHAPALLQMDTLTMRDGLNFGLWFRKAQLQEHATDTLRALESYQNAVKIYPAPDAQLALANLYAETKNPKALQLCKRIAALKMGRQYTAHCNFISGVYYARIGNKEKAIEFFNQSISNDYRYMEAYMEKGFLYYDAKQIKAAQQVFATVITIQRTYPDGHYWMAKTEEALGRTKEAIAFYQQAVALDPELIEAREALKRLGQN